MQHLSNVLNHFWKRWRNEYLIELRNAHRYFDQNDTIRTVSVGDVVVVHEEDQPRGKWRVGKILDLIVGSDGCTRGELWSKSEAREENARNSSALCSGFTL